MPLAIRNLTRAPVPRLPYRRLAERILGTNYELSVVLIGNTRAQTLNRLWRGKNYPANILTFPLDRNLGEIFLNLDQTSGVDLQPLFIHGLLHLKGLTHGSRMEQLENKNYAQSHHHRARRRHHVGQSRSL
jgi:rRNA maturation RNase YbeY